MELDVAAFRREKDAFFAVAEDSPLTAAQRQRFTGLAYFDEDPDLVLDLELDPDVEAGEVRMGTTGGGEQVYRRAGVVRFEIDGQPAQLTLFAADRRHDLFLPFRDATNGEQTYPAGRYLEVLPAFAGRVRVDFNRAYNPFCAYNPQWECPLPPPENWLQVPIRAGEQVFPDTA